MADEVFKTEREEYESQLAEMKKQLLEIKSLKKEESKVEEQIKDAQSNAELDMLKQELKSLQAESKAAKAEIEAQKRRDEEEKSLRRQAAENRFKSMIVEIPEEFKEAASAMFKGYTDPSEGLIAITKYKAQGLFGKKTIEVFNQIPRDTNNNKTDKVPSSREKFAKRTEALKNRRTGLVPGQVL
jgi:cell shape-determining protein MreC